MGRKRWWQGRSELLVLFIFHHVILGDGNVGCLFSKSLCNPRTETCYNDLAFGRCLPLYGDLSEEDYYQYDFNIDELELLRQQLERLQIDGYKWSHPYTQCIMLTSLYNLRHRENNDFGQCQRLKEIARFEDDNRIDQTRVPAIAIVKFTPNDGNSRSEYANELFYPPGTREEYARGTLYNEEFPRSPYKDETREFPRLYEPRYASSSYKEYVPFINEKNYEDRENTIRKKSFEEMNEKLYRTRRQPYNVRNYNDNPIESIKYALGEEAKAYPNQQDLSSTDTVPAEGLEFLINKSYYNKKEPDDDLDDEYWKAFAKKYKTPRTFSQFSDKDEFLLENVKRNSKNNDYDGEDYEDVNEEIELPRKDTSSLENAIYTEGGLVQPNNDKTDSDAEENTYDTLFDNDLNEYLWRRELAGFKRRERLDVKKPGPPFSTNNYAFKNQLQSSEEKENRSDSNETEQDDTFQDEELFGPFVKKEVVIKQSEESSSTSYHNVDLDHVYVEFVQPFHKWSEGEHVVKEVGKLLELTPGTLKDIRVGRAEVTFQVVKNNKNYNATDVVNKIDDIRGNLTESLGVEVTRAGIGDKIKLPATLEVVRAPEMNSSVFGALVAAGVAAAGAAAVVTLLIARRHAKSRAKLAGLATPDPEASKDYQDLCRARMQAKLPTHKLDSPFTAKISLESESNNLPSNRSSTSSWGDEPGSSNMDISTGKMVLSYMEDHLKNKDRLNQEWEVLRVHYPGSTEIAKSEENAKCNRPGTPLPYDHTRVILNDLANANNSDYINASTIVDHDPRNPAYIATQGPLPHTSADFWQLVWEQGSVVIVMLTRLTEDGVAMCHRYWPEEGSELYHIYEVHLVSEHFWCDDYLVRSFYLKNVRTGETRTVTQFHFLSWPENGVPYSTKALLEFRRKINKSYKGRSCPIVVHCSQPNARFWPGNCVSRGNACCWQKDPASARPEFPGRWKAARSSVLQRGRIQERAAFHLFHYAGRVCPADSSRYLLDICSEQAWQTGDGVGRTGTYCLIDMVLNRMMKGGKEIDIASTLEHIRDQRPDMVATKQQFEFVLMAVAEEVHAILKALPAVPAEKSPPPVNNTSTKEGQ